MFRAIVLFLLFTSVSVLEAQLTSFNYACRFVNNADCNTASQIPVCATNGILYPSECEFLKAHCKDVNLDVSKSNICGTTTPRMTTPTTNVSDPSMSSTTPNTNVSDPSMSSTTPNTNVSDPSMVITTTTDMVMNVTAMNNTMSTPGMSQTVTLTPVTTVMTTTPKLSLLCQVVVTSPCPPENSTLCGSDYNEYTNLCEFTKAQCYTNDLQVLNSGSCPITTVRPSMAFDIICRFVETMDCTEDGSVVCASDGNTFNNTCAYEKAKCENETLTIESFGSC